VGSDRASMLLRNATHVLIGATVLGIPLAVLDGRHLLWINAAMGTVTKAWIVQDCSHEGGKCCFRASWKFCYLGLVLCSLQSTNRNPRLATWITIALERQGKMSALPPPPFHPPTLPLNLRTSVSHHRYSFFLKGLCFPPRGLGSCAIGKGH